MVAMAPLRDGNEKVALDQPAQVRACRLGVTPATRASSIAV